MPRWLTMNPHRNACLALASAGVLLSGCAGAGPLGEPATGVAGLKAAEHQHQTAKIGQPDVSPRAGGSPEAPSGPEGNPTLGPPDTIGPH